MCVPTIPPTRNFKIFLVCRPLSSDRSLEPSEAFSSQDQQAGADSEVDQEADKPLTLSELSPQKDAAAPSREATPTPLDKVPMRMPTKRRSNSVVSNVLQKRKKSKTDATSADVSVVTDMAKTRLPATQKHPKPISSMRFNRSIKRKARVNGPGMKRPPVIKDQVAGLDAVDNRKDMRGIAASSCAGGMSKLKNSNEKGAEPVNSVNDKGKSIASGSSRVVRVFFFLLTDLIPI
jgi:hypothetical protein